MQVDLIESRLFYPASKHPRSEGIHISTVHKLIAQENGVLKRERPEEFGLVEVNESQDEWWESLEDHVQLKIGMGLAWEEWYIPQIGDVIDHPGELCVEGIFMTPDGESLDAILLGPGELLRLCIHEVKLTYKSEKTVGNLGTQWLWLAQAKAYCKGMGTTVVYLHVLFACGDYTFPIRPKLKIWRIIFTDAEIDDHWDTIKSFIAYYQAQGVLS